MRVAIVGATGAVGVELLRILEERTFPVASLRLLASKRSVGKELRFQREAIKVEEATRESFKGVDIAFFSAGASLSKVLAPHAVDAGALVVDNSSAFRMDAGVPLVVPEVNPKDAFQHKGVIANPNCSTIIMTVPLAPLHAAAGVRRCVAATYQAASGAGAAAMAELEQQARDWAVGAPLTTAIFGRQYIWNVFSHNSAVETDTGYNGEERKMIQETRKILGVPDLAVSATCVRVPVLRAHCEALNITLGRPMGVDEARAVLRSAAGVTVVDDREANVFPEPLASSGQDDVLVGRLRRDESQPDGCGLEMFVSGDQLRKGAATNAVQIAELVKVNRH